MNFQETVNNWYRQNKRDLPWRGTNDAYVIWLSEIIMQQTRVEQGLPYFNRFLSAFPSVQDFAQASETEILNLWQGLGYYSRGRNMLYTAREVLRLHNGVFPTDYSTLLTLKGVGSYTAAAISSFSSGAQQAVVDGNVFRLFARYFGIDIPINGTPGKKYFGDLAQELIQGQDASVYNQAVMEFGALQCKPKSPNCPICPLQIDCYARKNNLVESLPVKLKPGAKRIRHLNYFLCTNGDQLLVNKRTSADIWQHLYDFPSIETHSAVDFKDPEFIAQVQEHFGKLVSINRLSSIKHVLTHQIIYVQFFALDNYIINFNNTVDYKWVSWADLEFLPQSKVISSFLTGYLTKY